MLLRLLLALPVSVFAAEPPAAVKTLLAEKCGACHNDTAKASDFTLSAVAKGGKKFGRAIVGGHPEQSVLVRMIRGEMAPRMPLGGTLSAAEISLIEGWVRSLPAERAHDKEEWRWPYEKPVKTAPPPGGTNAVDGFVLARLQAAGLRLAPPAAPATLARRVYLDLIGLPPSPEELRAFVEDRSPDAYAKMIERLLADPRYGERWGRHWLDLVRYGETSGLEGDGAIGNAWRYRDWVIDAFNHDMPYDRFVMQQLAGADEHSMTRNNYSPNIQGHVPLGFLRVAPWDRSNLVAGEVRQNYLNEVTTTVGSVFLGLSVGCARCHDHKYDPIPQRDFYRLQAFFNAIQVENVDVPFKDPEFRAKAEAKRKEIQDRLANGPEKKALDEFETAALPRYRAARKEAAKGKKLVVDDLRLELRRKDSSVFSEAERRRHADLLEDANRTLDPGEAAALDKFEAALLPRMEKAGLERFDVLGVEELRGELGRSTSKIFDTGERNKHRDLSEALEVLRRRAGRWSTNALTVKNVPGPPNGPDIPPTRVLTRGDYRQPAETVEAGFLSAIDGKEQSAVIEQDRYRQFPTRGWRLTLAKWIASPENPLTARVMVNRIWQHHFGRGIVATPSDFGVNGERPTHPELLDWLANAFVESGWSVKAMHRIVLHSDTYRQSAENGTAANDLDNKLLSKYPRRRLDAEEIRDGILALSGRLNPERGGPSVFPPLPADLADFARYGRGGALMWEPNENAADARRRSVYTFQRRSMPLPMMAAFDAPVFSESCERRSSTTTALQALSLMNGSLVHEESVELVKTLRATDRTGQIREVFARILHRAPSSDEMDKFLSFAGPIDAVCRVLFNTNEFLYVE